MKFNIHMEQLQNELDPYINYHLKANVALKSHQEPICMSKKVTEFLFVVYKDQMNITESHILSNVPKAAKFKLANDFMAVYSQSMGLRGSTIC